MEEEDVIQRLLFDCNERYGNLQSRWERDRMSLYEVMLDMRRLDKIFQRRAAQKSETVGRAEISGTMTENLNDDYKTIGHSKEVYRTSTEEGKEASGRSGVASAEVEGNLVLEGEVTKGVVHKLLNMAACGVIHNKCLTRDYSPPSGLQTTVMTSATTTGTARKTVGEAGGKVVTGGQKAFATLRIPGAAKEKKSAAGDSDTTTVRGVAARGKGVEMVQGQAGSPQKIAAAAQKRANAALKRETKARDTALTRTVAARDSTVSVCWRSGVPGQVHNTIAPLNATATQGSQVVAFLPPLGAQGEGVAAPQSDGVTTRVLIAAAAEATTAGKVAKTAQGHAGSIDNTTAGLVKWTANREGEGIPTSR